ncbi:uncharacterized protein BDCG_01377 [Blastomyces dermatitidis ER-3]|uniref:Carboxylesterase family protein n=2 Tax=Ajellomyces dermatitidis (strain ER-3 / ATCC MYA-2586) TaxID=559297 RepID=A0ABX2VRI7_AJEDR|nr:uncharacterized protein BDCG_01377 [Blastomyces dermatitidis ER-3]OAS99836.1 hypothetical protein BDCG_01377 [Blastomyces dermatitidis ER-3]
MPRVTRAVSRRNNTHDIKDPINPPHTSLIEASNSTSTFPSTRRALEETTGNHDHTQISPENISIASKSKREKEEITRNNPTRRVTGIQLKRSRSIRDLINPEELGIKVFGNTLLGDVDRHGEQTPPTRTGNNRTVDSQRGQKDIITPDPMSQVIEEQVSPKSQPLQLVPSQITQTPRFDPELHKSPVKEELADEDEDSFLQSIRPAFKSNSNDKWANPETRSVSSTSHAQARNYQDIVDPLDAIDALEDALEQIGQALPVVEEHGLDSPLRAGTPADGIRSSRKNNTSIASKKPNAAIQHQRSEDEQRSRPREAKLSQRPSLSMKTRQSSVAAALSTKNSDRPVSKPARSASTDSRPGPIRATISRKSSHPNLSSDTMPTLTSRTTKARPNSTAINSILKPGFTPSKSTKPPTRPTFELPGEAISRRQKAQREERLKREEEELQRRREFKARALRNYSTPSLPVKETVASRSRATLNAEEAQQNINTLAKNPRRSASLQSRRSSALASTRTSSLRSAVTRNAASSHTQPDTTDTPATPARLAKLNTRHKDLDSNRPPPRDQDNPNPSETSPVSSSSNNNNNNNLTTPTTTTTSTSTQKMIDGTLSVQRSRGKEIFARDRIHEIERDRERREKEEAAKRARTEAAERGRLASREWAEKQKLKLKLARKSQTDLAMG